MFIFGRSLNPSPVEKLEDVFFLIYI
jgi:hypothetical protein